MCSSFIPCVSQTERSSSSRERDVGLMMLYTHIHSLSAPCEPFSLVVSTSMQSSHVLQRIFWPYYAHVNGWVWHSWLFFSLPFFLYILLFFLCRRKREKNIQLSEGGSFILHFFSFYLFTRKEKERERGQQLVPSGSNRLARWTCLENYGTETSCNPHALYPNWFDRKRAGQPLFQGLHHVIVFVWTSSNLNLTAKGGRKREKKGSREMRGWTGGVVMVERWWMHLIDQSAGTAHTVLLCV
jgi:hypothetical protein